MTQLIIKFIDYVAELLVFMSTESLIASEVVNNITSLFSYGFEILKAVNFMIPVPDIFGILGIMISVKIAMFVMFIINWVIKRVFDVIP